MRETEIDFLKSEGFKNKLEYYYSCKDGHEAEDWPIQLVIDAGNDFVTFLTEKINERDKKMRAEGFKSGWIKRSNFENHWGVFEDYIPDKIKEFEEERLENGNKI